MKWLYLGKKESVKIVSKRFQESKVQRRNFGTKPQTFRTQSQNDLPKTKVKAPRWITADQPSHGPMHERRTSLLPCTLFSQSFRDADDGQFLLSQAQFGSFTQHLPCDSWAGLEDAADWQLSRDRSVSGETPWHQHSGSCPAAEQTGLHFK